MKHDFPDEWWVDRESDHKATVHRVKGQVFAGSTAFQQVKILDTYDLGKILLLDHQLQSAEIDEFIYHECLVHPAMILGEDIRRVLILGGGEGATLREVVKYRQVENIVMLDIDAELIDICKTHLPGWHGGAYEDPRVSVLFADALEFVEHTTDIFDLVIMDINDPRPEGPAALIYTREFFQDLEKILSDTGVFATQATAISLGQADLHSVLHRTLAAVFPQVESYGDYIPSFECLWGFLLASRHSRASALTIPEVDDRIAKRLTQPLRYYDGQTHQRLFSLPKAVRENLRAQKRISTRSNPLSVYL